MKTVTLKDMRDEAIAKIKNAFAENNKLHIAAHPGQFNETEIKRLANQTPAILTSLLRYSDEEHSVSFANWILYRADSKDRLYDGALKIVSALIPVLKDLDAEWSMGGGHHMEAECLYSGTLDQINITLWGVRWKWDVSESCFYEGGMSLLDLENFEGYDATHNIENAVAQDNVQL
jgi:hypothetical protein